MSTASSPAKSKPAVQLVLGSQAINFPLVVSIKKLDGTEATLTLTCKALRKTAWAQAKDAHQAAFLKRATDPVAEPVHESSAAPEAQAAPQADALVGLLSQTGVAALVRRGLESDATLVAQFATGWDLADPFTLENLQALEDEFGGAISAIVQRYDQAIYQGRLGN